MNKQDVLTVMDASIDADVTFGVNPEYIEAMCEARAAVAELIEAVQFVLKYDGQRLGSISESALRAALAHCGGAA